MVEPGNVYLTQVDKRTWLTDQVVILDVTGFSAIEGLEDGWYRIVASGVNAGLRPRSPGLELNITNWLKEVRSRSYWNVIPTEISFTEDDAKAFLLIVDIAPVVRYETHGRIPVAMNESVWKDFRTAWPDAQLSHPGYTGPFRVSVPGNDELAYIEQIEIPDRLHEVVGAIIDVYQRRNDGKGNTPAVGGSQDHGSTGGPPHLEHGDEAAEHSAGGHND